MENMHLLQVVDYKHLFTHTNDKTPQLLYQNLSTVIYRQLLSKPIFSALTELFLHFPHYIGETGGKSLLAQAFVYLWELLGFCELPTIRPYWTALPPPSFSCFSRLYEAPVCAQVVRLRTRLCGFHNVSTDSVTIAGTRKASLKKVEP